jgi:hypothetical protein
MLKPLVYIPGTAGPLNGPAVPTVDAALDWARGFIIPGKLPDGATFNIAGTVYAVTPLGTLTPLGAWR